MFQSPRSSTGNNPLSFGTPIAQTASSEKTGFRLSKFHGLCGIVDTAETFFYDVKPARMTAWDTNILKANSKFFALPWENSGLGVFPLNSPCVIPQPPKRILGHTKRILDHDFSPFNDNLIATASEDSYVMLWGLPSEGLEDDLTEPLATLTGHIGKVGTVNFHPSAMNVLATSSMGDYRVRIWDAEESKQMQAIGGHPDVINSVSWNHNGSILATNCKDRVVRLFDPRTGTETIEELGERGDNKYFRISWLGNKNVLLCVGLSKSGSRHFSLWDSRNLSSNLCHVDLDRGSRVIMPFYDSELGILYLAGKGNNNVQCFEIVDQAPFSYYLTEYKASNNLNGMAMLPQDCCSTDKYETSRFLRLTTDNVVESVAFVLPDGIPSSLDSLMDDGGAADEALESLTPDDWMSGKEVGRSSTASKRSLRKQKSDLSLVASKENKIAEFNEGVSKKLNPGRDLSTFTVAELRNLVSFLQVQVDTKTERINELESELAETKKFARPPSWMFEKVQTTPGSSPSSTVTVTTIPPSLPKPKISLEPSLSSNSLGSSSSLASTPTILSDVTSTTPSSIGSTSSGPSAGPTKKKRRSMFGKLLDSDTRKTPRAAALSAVGEANGADAEPQKSSRRDKTNPAKQLSQLAALQAIGLRESPVPRFADNLQSFSQMHSLIWIENTWSDL